MEALLLLSTAGQPVSTGLNHLRRLCPALFSLPSTCSQLLVQQQPAPGTAQSRGRHAARPTDSRLHGWQRAPAPIAPARGFSSSSHSSLTDAATAADPQAGTVDSHSARTLSHFEMSDTLTLAAAIRRFRSRGHLVSQLDPLQRIPGGPWLGPIGDAYTRCERHSHSPSEYGVLLVGCAYALVCQDASEHLRPPCMYVC
jgi:hypothetical protein